MFMLMTLMVSPRFYAGDNGVEFTRGRAYHRSMDGVVNGTVEATGEIGIGGGVGRRRW